MKTSLISLFIILALSVQGNIPDNVKIQSKYAAATSVDSGKPVGIVLTAYKTTMIANGKDETIIRVFVVDSAGREIRTAEVPIQISVNGDAKITGTKNGIPVEFKKTEERTSQTLIRLKL
jgi:hypothetical protein